MPVTLIATPGDPAANSYVTVAEANAYFESRIPLVPPWDTTSDAASRALISATRVIDSLATGRRRLMRPPNDEPYYVVGRQWTGSPATTTQVLAWPRIGMKNRNGNDIAANAIPQELKDATAELAGQLQSADRTLDNAVSTQGIRSVSAGSVSVSFKDDIAPAVISDMTLNLMPPSWFTEEFTEGAVGTFDFTVI